MACRTSTAFFGAVRAHTRAWGSKTLPHTCPGCPACPACQISKQAGKRGTSRSERKHQGKDRQGSMLAGRHGLPCLVFCMQPKRSCTSHSNCSRYPPSAFEHEVVKDGTDAVHHCRSVLHNRPSVIVCSGNSTLKRFILASVEPDNASGCGDDLVSQKKIHNASTSTTQSRCNYSRVTHPLEIADAGLAGCSLDSRGTACEERGMRSVACSPRRHLSKDRDK